MASAVLAEEVDFIQELRLRRWARENYVPTEQRDASWHPVIHDEMSKKDRESDDATVFCTQA
jgi:hypothetical protein